MAQESAGPMWRRSSRCSSGGCVEVARTDRHVRLRDTKDPSSPELVFTTAQWWEFVAGVRAGDFDRPD